MKKTEMERFAQCLCDSANENGDFFETVMAAQDVKSLHKLLSDNGFQLSLEEVEIMYAKGMEKLQKSAEQTEDGELTEEQLQDAAGGGAWRGVLRGAVCVAGACAFTYACWTINPGLAVYYKPLLIGAVAWTAAGCAAKGW